MTYFDSRGVSRVYRFSAERNVWRFWRDSPDLAQRYVNTIADDGNRIAAEGFLSKNVYLLEGEELHGANFSAAAV